MLIESKKKKKLFAHLEKVHPKVNMNLTQGLFPIEHFQNAIILTKQASSKYVFVKIHGLHFQLL